MDLKLKDKSVIVTASSRGIGKAIAQEFAREGANVVISGRSEIELKRTLKEIKRQTTKNQVNYFVCDVTHAEDIHLLVEKTVKLFGAVDILVYNSGGPPAGTFGNFNDQDWESAFELILLSIIRSIREVIPYMKKQKSGRILNIASSSVRQVIDNLILSNVFRPAIVGLTKSLSQELAQYGILINTIGPGKINTQRIVEMDKLRAERAGISYEEQVSIVGKSIPVGRYGTPTELAIIAVFLCSSINTYLTGQTILVDGGLVKCL